MRFVIAAGTPESAAALAACPESSAFELRSGSMAATGAGCDVALVCFPLAADFSGATWVDHAAQVLVNERADGEPPVIAVLPTVAEWHPSGPRGRDTWPEWAVTEAIDALADAVGSIEHLTVLVHLEAAALDGDPSAAVAALDRIVRAARPSRTDVEARFAALLSGAESRDAVDRWAAQHVTSDVVVDDDPVRWALHVLHGIDLRRGPEGPDLHDDAQVAAWSREFRERCASDDAVRQATASGATRPASHDRHAGRTSAASAE